MDMQEFINNMGSAWREERSESQMTLGKLIEYLDTQGDEFVENLSSPDSYRGYYCDLAFEKNGTFTMASELKKECQLLIGMVFTGYKGGEFEMNESTPLWIAEYGKSGEKLMGYDSENKIITEEDN